MNIKEIWNNKEFLSKNLTVEDMKDLIEYIIPWLKNMELKFLWDYHINEMRLPSFVDCTMRKMYEIVNQEYKEEYELYPKQQDFEALYNIIIEYPMTETIKHDEKIWELVRDKILEISRETLT